MLVEVSGEPELIDEGCLSVPGFSGSALRHPFARVAGIDLDGNEVELEGTGLMAQALQHETDHLDGKLYLDRLEQETAARRDAADPRVRLVLSLAAGAPTSRRRLRGSAMPSYGDGQRTIEWPSVAGASA